MGVGVGRTAFPSFLLGSCSVAPQPPQLTGGEGGQPLKGTQSPPAVLQISLSSSAETDTHKGLSG